ncbi:MAG: hypothetical protein K9M55_00790 [Candidatus Marinimicrobia bacterium]|nr:hypothetical protein [Candidatus Neomarinimicrobiota bacterium]
MQDFLDLLMSNKIYLAIAIIIAIGLVIFLLKKVLKLFLIMLAVVLAYGVFLYATEDDPMQAIKDKLNLGKSTVKQLDDATLDFQREAIDKVIDEVDKKLKKSGSK